VRAFRGLFLVFVLSFLSLVGVLLTVTALGGLEDWTRWQFIGLFGMVEAASGLANIVLPNIWRLPVAEMQTKRTRVRLAASTIGIPHWGGAARAVAGAILIVVASVAEGSSPDTALVVVVVGLFGVMTVGVSAAVARLGVERPDLDVVQFIIRRGGRDRELPPISLGASILQFFLSIITVPVVKLVPASAFFSAGLAPSAEAVAVLAGVTLLSVAAGLGAWWGRIDWRAPREQQREAEAHA
jgi:hypothetical protein